MIEQLKKLFAAPSPEMMALRELEDAKRSLLTAQTSREYAESLVKFREQQIKRLTAYIKELE
jgi:hypothetical protein